MSSPMVKTLGDALLHEIERVQGIIAEYDKIPAGRFAASLMRMDIKKAHQAMMEGDVVQMLAAYKNLKEYEW